MSFLVPKDNKDLRRFIQKWYGPPRPPDPLPEESPDAPDELVEWHQIFFQWGGTITSHNYAIPLRELAPEDGKIPFWVENQGTWVWAFDPEAKDHPVYEREPSDEPTPWRHTGERLTDFLVHATVVEAILGAPATKITQGAPTDWLWLQEGARELPFHAWNWPARDSRIFCGESWLALVHPSNEPKHGYDITLAATTPADLDWAQNAPGIKWRSYFDSQVHTIDDPPPW